ncbi:hypothetical protein AHF37_06026 [Paragonimus kellicotti]|nr:hypothetical protein AHF37_06026 [Paragonimus kellicotti]
MNMALSSPTLSVTPLDLNVNGHSLVVDQVVEDLSDFDGGPMSMLGKDAFVVPTELREIQYQMNRLPNPTEPEQVIQMLTLRRDVMFLQFDVCMRTILCETFLAAGNLEAYRAPARDRMQNAFIKRTQGGGIATSKSSIESEKMKREDFFIIGYAFEKKGPEDDLDVQVTNPRSLRARPRRVLSTDGTKLYNFWFIPHFIEVLFVFRHLDDQACTKALRCMARLACVLHDILHYLVAYARLGITSAKITPEQRQQIITGSQKFRDLVKIVIFPLAELSNMQRPCLNAIEMNVPEPLEPRDEHCQVMFPWRSLMNRQGPFLLFCFGPSTTEYNIRLCLAGLKPVDRPTVHGELLAMNLSLEDVLEVGDIPEAKAGEALPIQQAENMHCMLGKRVRDRRRELPGPNALSSAASTVTTTATANATATTTVSPATGAGTTNPANANPAHSTASGTVVLSPTQSGENVGPKGSSYGRPERQQRSQPIDDTFVIPRTTTKRIFA